MLYDGSAATAPDGAVRIPAGTGVKSRATFAGGPNVTYTLTADMRCDAMATIEVRSAELDAQGQWLSSYAGIPGNSVSWPDWVTVTFALSFGAETKASQGDVEFIALGGEGAVRNVRVVRGGHLERR